MNFRLSDPADPTIFRKGAAGSGWLAEAGGPLSVCNSFPHILLLTDPVPDIACCWGFTDRWQHAWH